MSNQISKVLNKNTKSNEKVSSNTEPMVAPEPHPMVPQERVDELGEQFYDKKLYKRGFIYLLWVKRAMELNEAVFKIGMTEGNDCIHRLKSYDKGGIIIGYWFVNNPAEVEVLLKKKFGEMFDRDVKYGKEYFAGNSSKMIEVIQHYIVKGGYHKHEYLEALAANYKVIHEDADGDKIMSYNPVGPRTKAAHERALIDDHVSSKTACKKVGKKKSVDKKNIVNTVVDKKNNVNTVDVSKEPVKKDSDTNHLGRTKHNILFYDNINDAVKGLCMNYKDTRDKQAGKSIKSDISLQYNFILKASVNNKTYYGVYQRFSDRVTIMRPDIYGCEFVYFFTSIPRIVAENASTNGFYHIVDQYKDSIMRDASCTQPKPSEKIKYVQYKQDENEIDENVLRTLYDDLEVIALTDDEKLQIGIAENSTLPSLVRSEVLARRDAFVKFMETKRTNNKNVKTVPLEKKSANTILTESTIDTSVKDIDDVSEEISQTNNLPTDIGFGNGGVENLKE